MAGEEVMRFLVGVAVRGIYRLRQGGLEHVPKEGAAALVCNHVSFVDACILAAACPRPIRFVMDHSIFRLPVLGLIFRVARAIPIASAREDAKRMQRALDEIADALRHGELVCIFPEGKITRDGEMSPFKRGVERILERTPVPVVPVALRGLWGSFFSRKYGHAMCRPFPRGLRAPVAIVCGPPISPEDGTATRLYERVRTLRGDVR